MSRLRKYGDDLTYAEEHRHRLPELYGERIGSNYQAQGLKLSKHFRT